MTHFEFLQVLIPAVRQAGPVAALEQLPAPRTHQTIATFFVWAVARLVDAGLTDSQILWHPLVDANSPLAWYSEALLATPEAFSAFVPADKALDGEPQPTVLVLAAA
jgi:hypothetical protein